MALAYALIPLAALIRWLGAEIPALSAPAILIAGALWLTAFGLFTAALWPVFWGPRAARAPAKAAPT